MPAMKIDEIRGKSPEVLAAEFAAMKRELFDLRFKSASQSLPDPSRIRMLRRTIARMGTILRQREMGSPREAASKAASSREPASKVASSKKPESAKGKGR